MDGVCVIDMSGFGVGICIGGVYNAPSVRIMQPDSIGQALAWMASVAIAIRQAVVLPGVVTQCRLLDKCTYW